MGNRDREVLPERLDRLFGIINELGPITRLDDGDEPEARTLAYSLLEIEESCRRFIEQLDALFARAPQHALPELEGLREELRHIVYHIHDSRFLRVINPRPDDQ
jgi:hypothetical protein